LTGVRTVVEIDAPLDQVWKVVADPRNLPRWDRHIVSVSGVPRGGLEVGSTYRTEVRFMGAKAQIQAEVLEIDPPKFSRIRLSGVLDAVVNTRLEPLGARRTKLEHDIEYGFRGGLGRLAAHALRLTGGANIVLRRGTLAQKRQIEELTR
jgi:carbon monoxide dehydrogenase subunit G